MTYYRKIIVAGRLTYKFIPVTIPQGATVTLIGDNSFNSGVCRWQVDFKNSKGKWTGFTAFTCKDEKFFK